MSDNEYESKVSLNRSRSRSPIGSDDDRDRDRSRRSDRKRFDRTQKSGGGGGGGRRPNSDRRVYVSNIPYEYKWQALKDLFRQQVGEVAYVEIFNDEINRPKGCAIIEFETAERAQKAIDTMHRYELKGRKLVVKEVTKDDFDSDRDRHGRMMDDNNRLSMPRSNYDSRGSSNINSLPGMGNVPQQNWGNTYGLSIPFLESLAISPPLVNKVFVANLDYKVDDTMLEEVFKMAGKVVSAEISKDSDGKSRGFGVVEFEHPVESVQAISMLNNQSYYERKLSVRMDRRDKVSSDSGSSKLPQGLKGLGMGLGLNGQPLTDVSNLNPNSSANPSQGVPNMSSMNMGMSSMATNMNSNMPINNLPNLNQMANMNANPMASMQQMSSMANMNAPMNPNMMSMNSMNNMTMNTAGNLGNNVGAANMTSAAGLGMNQAMLGANTAMPAGFAGGNNYTSNMGSRIDYGNSGNQSNYSSGRNVVQINNLPHNYTWQALRDMCREYGDIGFAEIRSKGTGTIRFIRESDAQRAADMLSRQRCEGRILDARVI